MPKNHRNIVVSPSGGFYGSEQTLLNYLLKTSLQFDVFIPLNSGSKFNTELSAIKRHRIYRFSNPMTLYLRLAMISMSTKMTGRKLSLYVNEGGHLRYLSVLHRFFPWLILTVHIRLLEDVNERPWESLKVKRMNILSTSNYIQNELGKKAVQSQQLSSPIRVDLVREVKLKIDTSSFVIVSRLSNAKGIQYVKLFLETLELLKVDVCVHHFGGVNEDALMFVKGFSEMNHVVWHSHGFEENKEDIFSKGILLHLNPAEPLGVVLLEALSFGIPFLAFNSGGTGEIATKFDLLDFTCDHEMSGWQYRLNSKWESLRQQDNSDIEMRVQNAFDRGKRFYDPSHFAKSLDSILKQSKINFE